MSCSFLLITCRNHFDLLSWSFFAISPTFLVPLILSFLILSSFLTPHMHHSIRISVTSNLLFCAFSNTHVSAPYTSATTVMYTFPIKSVADISYLVSPCTIINYEMESRQPGNGLELDISHCADPAISLTTHDLQPGNKYSDKYKAALYSVVSTTHDLCLFQGDPSREDRCSLM